MFSMIFFLNTYYEVYTFRL